MIREVAISVTVIVGIVIFLTIILVFLTPFEKKAKKEAKQREENKRKLYVNQVLMLKRSKKHPKQIIEDLNKLAKEFFQERFSIPPNLEYPEIAEIFEKRNREDISNFCKKIEETLYSGREISKNKFDDLLRSLERIAIKESKEEQKEKVSIETEMNKKSLKREIDDYQKTEESLKDKEEKRDADFSKFISSRPKHQLIEQIPKQGPQTVFLGKIKETKENSYLSFNNLRNHVIIAGDDKSGKTFSSQSIVEGALLKNKSAVIFDPTAKWTGFFRKCQDQNMIKKYKDFGIDEKNRVSFRGMVKTIKDPYEIVNIEEYLSFPGEITILDMSQLRASEIDLFVSNTLEQIFRSNLENSINLKGLIVYENAHNLLSDFGSSGKSISRFKNGMKDLTNKGIGVLLSSKNLYDFKKDLGKDIGVKIQMRTTKERDLGDIKLSHGVNFSENISKMPTGTGMIESRSHNQGKPYFILFRPLMHDTNSLNEEEIKIYDKYIRTTEGLEYRISRLRKLGVNISDLNQGLNLVKDSIKRGKFKIAASYIQTLTSRIEDRLKDIKNEKNNLSRRGIEKPNFQEDKYSLEHENKVIKQIDDHSQKKIKNELKKEPYLKLQKEEEDNEDAEEKSVYREEILGSDLRDLRKDFEMKKKEIEKDFLDEEKKKKKQIKKKTKKAKKEKKLKKKKPSKKTKRSIKKKSNKKKSKK